MSRMVAFYNRDNSVGWTTVVGFTSTDRSSIRKSAYFDATGDDGRDGVLAVTALTYDPWCSAPEGLNSTNLEEFLD